ncbi:hypothetical protein APHAL10511_006906 [Amanita phalloides]|nr:hypothetical protein APHAL10511_006906 [Amanita phalloides]
MSGDKNKNRLFITLQYRLERPDFHWGLLLSPKSESDDRNDKDSHLFHVTNSLSLGVQIMPGQKPGWRYEEKPANVLRSRTITARVLVAKLSGTESVEMQAQRIHRVLRDIPLRQNDERWTCRVWVEQALRALRALGGEFGSIPDVTVGGRWEEEIKDFSEKAKASILKGKMIVHPRDLAELDLRGR